MISRETFGPGVEAVPALRVGGADCLREEFWEHGAAGGYGYQGCRPRRNDASCEWHVFTKGLLKMRAVVGVKPQGLSHESFQCMPKTSPFERSGRRTQEEWQLERERADGPLPASRMYSSRKTNPYFQKEE